MFLRKPRAIPEAADALPGRDEPAYAVPERHAVLDAPLLPPYPDGIDYLYVGMGCFWGAERIFWQTPGVYSTAVGYAGGSTPNPTYREVCTGMTGHTEAVLVAYDPKQISTEQVMRLFWEGHDPTQGMRQGNDHGTPVPLGHLLAHAGAARRCARHPRRLRRGPASAQPRRDHDRDRRGRRRSIPAEDYHQQYLEKNPGGYCGIGGTGVSCPIGVGVSAS